MAGSVICGEKKTGVGAFGREGSDLEYYNEERAAEIIPTCKIYNKEYHNARFALPNYLKEIL